MARILLIDDDNTVRIPLKRILEQAGHDVVEAPDGARGVRLFRESPTDLVITDILMPDKDGIETILELRREYPDTKVIAMTGGGKHGYFETLQIAKLLGASRVLEKPFASDELLAAVEAALAG